MFSKLLKSISDDDLLRRLSGLVQQSRRVESDLVAHIAEVDARRLYAREACSSMFAYCTEVLHLSEWEAYLRIAVARASREHPNLLAMLEDGRLHLSGIAKIAPLLTEANRGDRPGSCGAQVKAGNRGAGGRAFAQIGCSDDDAQATRTHGKTKTDAGTSTRSGPSNRSTHFGEGQARISGAAGPRPLQGPVHGQCGASREARATQGAQTQQRFGGESSTRP